jgi:hypothetical protein
MCSRSRGKVIFGSAAEAGRLERSFEMRNVFKTHPGNGGDGFSLFDSDDAATNLQQESEAGLFADRVTFLLGRRVAAGLCRTESYESVLSEDNRFVAPHGWIDWIPVEGRFDVLGLYLIVPHPQSCGFRYRPEDLVKLSALFRAALLLPPLDFQFSFRSQKVASGSSRRPVQLS